MTPTDLSMKSKPVQRKSVNNSRVFIQGGEDGQRDPRTGIEAHAH